MANAPAADIHNTPEAAMRRNVTYGILAALTPLVPIPFIDDLLLQLVRRRLLRSHFEAAGARITEAQLTALTRVESSGLLGCIGSVVIYPIKKIFRKIFFVLALKDAVDNASAVLHEGYLFWLALQRGWVGEHTLASGETALLAFKGAVELTCKQTDTRPLNQVLRATFLRSRVALKQAAKSVGAMLRKAGWSRGDPGSMDRGIAGVEQSAPGPVNDLTNELQQAVFAESGYLKQLEERLEKNVRGAGPR